MLERKKGKKSKSKPPRERETLDSFFDKSVPIPVGTETDDEDDPDVVSRNPYSKLRSLSGTSSWSNT